MKKIFLAIVLAVLLIGFYIFRIDSFDRFVDQSFYKMVRTDPEALTNLGIATNAPFDFFSGKLTDISAKKCAKSLYEVKRLRERLQRYGRSRLSEAQQLTFDILSHSLDETLASASFAYGLNESGNTFNPYPVNQLFGLQNSLPDFLVNMHQVSDYRSAVRYAKRLGEWERKFTSLLADLSAREKNGVILPRFLIDKVIAECQGFIQDPPNENMLYTSFQEKLQTASLSPGARAKLESATLRAIQEKVYPSYQMLIAFLQRQREIADDNAGVWKFPRGAEYYAGCLRYHTTTSETPEAVHALGLSEVARIQGEMREILDRLGYQGRSIKEAMRAIADVSLYPDTAEARNEILSDYRAILKAVEPKLKTLFQRLPKAKLKIEAVPEYKAKTAPFAYYDPGDLNGSRPGVFFVNTSDLKNQTKFTMPTLAYHEGLPGHHLQIAIAQEIPNLPLFRKIALFNAYVEGWALYCEKLASEYEFTNIPYHDLGRLQYELMRAVRLVVDTGIHHKRWTREQAIDYMASATGQNLNEVAIEIDRYIVIPGQACSYKIGMIKLLELREKMRERLGSRFDIARFHSLVLDNGAMPLSVLEEYLNRAE